MARCHVYILVLAACVLSISCSPAAWPVHLFREKRASYMQGIGGGAIGGGLLGAMIPGMSWKQGAALGAGIGGLSTAWKNNRPSMASNYQGSPSMYGSNQGYQSSGSRFFGG
ncbi:hypothetical protein RvY_13331 [Ramazzottius varieornatus]|uniref:Glycine zipper 2TM domain-containing protein n=1 Tax=Ramazzottius varieornatus TaxID=947166 RepID=A0A1D1VPD1_RAMVA|nr:hypothetical protein RvY_13331 [Ramazzottius varieornatus]